MKKFIYTLIVVSFSLLSQAWAWNQSEVGLYTKEEFVLQPINRITEILERIHSESPETNIIFYIHGRGSNPEKEWKNLKQLESLYGARVIMFRWPSWTSRFTRPVKKAKDSAAELALVFQDIKIFKENSPDIFAKKKLSLLVHSMGHVVLREFVEKHYANDLNDSNSTPLFDNYVSTGADVGLSDHRKWVSAIDFAKRKFITMNNRDLILILSYLLDLKDKLPQFYKLGLGFTKIPIKRSTVFKLIDEKSTYIDLSNILKSEHRYFQAKQTPIKKLFHQILNGKEFNPKEIGIKIKAEKNIAYVQK